jgi:anti-anti-sigma factor
MRATNKPEFELEVIPERSCLKHNELVLGYERDLVARVAPLARRQSIALNLEAVGRVDAAGVAALVELYLIACRAGHEFRVVNASSHVARVLAVCGLDGILLSHNVVQHSYSGRQVELTAA